VELWLNREAGAIDDGQGDRDNDPLLYPHKGHREKGDHRERKFKEIKVCDREKVSTMKDSRRNKHQNCGKSGEWKIAEKTNRGYDRDHRSRSKKTGHLGATSRRGDRCSSRRTRISGKRPDDPREHRARTYSNKVTTHIDAVVPKIGECP
jgi:hypothetical protein